MIDRRLVGNIDWPLIALLLFNSVLGLAFIYSSSHYLPGNYYLKQALWIFFSLAVLFFILLFDYKTLVAYSLYFYAFFILVLALMLLFGKKLFGSTSWIKLGFIWIQPSELTKIIVILFLARLFSEFKRNYVSFSILFLSGALTALPILLVAFQPDLGTALTFPSLLVASLLLAGMRRKTVIFLLVMALLLGFLVWNFGLEDYQKKRLTTLVFPSQDPKGAGYHILQSKIAIGSGGFLGKGFKKGSQSQLRFLPARHTDFIFSVLGEEFGFLGVVAVIFSYFLFLSRLFKSSGKSRDRTGVYIAFMVAMMIAFQFFVNVMMIIGLFPITGIPLPLLSYGGSSLLATYLGVGLILNIKMRRFANV